MSKSLFVWSVREIGLIFGRTIIEGISHEGCPTVDWEAKTMEVEIFIGHQSYIDLYNASITKEEQIIKILCQNKLFFTGFGTVETIGNVVFGVEYPRQRFRFNIQKVYQIHDTIL